MDLPPDETGPVPVTLVRTEPHWFGMTPPLFTLAIGCGVIVVAIALFVSGSWAYGLIALGAGALFFAVYLESARRRRNSRVARVTADVRERAGSTIESLRARSVAAVETRRVHNELAMLRTERRDGLLKLGEAAHGDDKKTEKETRARLKELDEREQELQQQLEEHLHVAGERIRKAKLSVDRTMMVAPAYPPPDEGNPPTPEPVPEPYPPDEIEPPGTGE